MSKSTLNYFVTACAVLLLSCALLTPGTPEQATVPMSTATPLPATATASPSPAPTLVPTDTPTPSPTPIPWPSQPITAENAKELKEINSWGRGSPLGIEKLERGDDQLLVLTSLGVYLYQTTSPYVLAFFPDADEFTVSQDESLMAVSLKNGDVQIWNMSDLSLKQTFTHTFPEDILKKIEEEQLLPYYVGGLAFSPDNSEIAVGYADGAVELYRIGETASYATLRHDSFSLWQTDIGLVFQLSYSPDGKNLVVFKYAPYINANRLTFWSLPEGKLVSVSNAARFYAFSEPAYLPDNQTLLVFSRKDSYFDLTLWNVQTGTKLNSFGTNLAKIISTELAQNGDELTIYGSDAQENYYRQVRDLPQGDWIENEKLDEPPEQEYLARTTNFLFEQGHYYNSWGDEEKPTFAQLGLGEDQAFRVLGESYWLTFPEGVSESLNLPEEAANPYYDPQEQTIGWCTRGALHFQDKDGQITTIELSFITHCEGVVISPQRHYAAVWYGESLYLVNLETAKFNKLAFNKWSIGRVLAASFSSDEEILAASVIGVFNVWQVEPLQKLASSNQSGVRAASNREIVISKDKSFAVALNGGDRIQVDQSQIFVWRLADAFTVHTISPPFIETRLPEFTTFALSPNDELIASGDDFGRIRIWSVKSGEELAEFDVDAWPLDLAFTPDGSGLIIVLGDGTVRLWGVP